MPIETGTIMTNNTNGSAPVVEVNPAKNISSNVDKKYPDYYDDDQHYNLKTVASEGTNLFSNPEVVGVLE
ncbi:MAG: hypothetical protein HKN87_19855 [Saprospiraceae bacterium]|nr:hypothetical protein [Saprospiraceae bacterium]